MKTIKDYNKLDKNVERAVALGNFDGVHIGHQKLIETLIKKSKLNRLQSCIYTFTNHTLKVITGKEGPAQITDISIKEEIFNSLGVDILYLEEFNEEIMTLSSEDFVKNILIDKLNCRVVVVGFDYHFGYKGEGNIDSLKKIGNRYGIEVHIIPPILINGQIVSSSLIREDIKNGRIEEANLFLGRPYSIHGQIIHGKGIGGSKLGYPTANILIEPNHLIPKEGVYATFVKIKDSIYKGATCIGTSPTVGDYGISVETYIIDFSGNIYDEFIEIEFIKRIRDQIKFDCLTSLREQMNKDVNSINTYLQL